MKTRKHLDILVGIAVFAMCICIMATIICLIGMIVDKDPVPFLWSAGGLVSSYFVFVFLNVIIDFYEAIVNKQKSNGEQDHGQFDSANNNSKD